MTLKDHSHSFRSPVVFSLSAALALMLVPPAQAAPADSGGTPSVTVGGGLALSLIHI